MNVKEKFIETFVTEEKFIGDSGEQIICALHDIFGLFEKEPYSKRKGIDLYFQEYTYLGGMKEDIDKYKTLLLSFEESFFIVKFLKKVIDFVGDISVFMHYAEGYEQGALFFDAGDGYMIGIAPINYDEYFTKKNKDKIIKKLQEQNEYIKDERKYVSWNKYFGMFADDMVL